MGLGSCWLGCKHQHVPKMYSPVPDASATYDSFIRTFSQNEEVQWQHEQPAFSQMVVRVPAPNKLKTTQSCSYDTATKPPVGLNMTIIMKSNHCTEKWALCLISTILFRVWYGLVIGPRHIPTLQALLPKKPHPTPFSFNILNTAMGRLNGPKC